RSFNAGYGNLVGMEPLHGICRSRPDGRHTFDQRHDMKPRAHIPANWAASRPGLLRAIAGLLIWSASFLTLYVAHAEGCELMPPVTPRLLRTGLIVLWVLPLVVLGVMAAASWRRFQHARTPRAKSDPP